MLCSVSVSLGMLPVGHFLHCAYRDLMYTANSLLFVWIYVYVLERKPRLHGLILTLSPVTICRTGILI